MMKKVAIVEYGMGNLDSVARAVQECGGDPVVTREASIFETVSAIILPGVGAFPAGMQNLRQFGLEEILRQQVLEQGIPFLGICLGMQLLATKGWEVEETEGLGWIAGEVLRLQSDRSDVRIPHVGWNEVIFERSFPLFKGVPSSKDFYFVHSYHFSCRNPEHELAHTPYCGSFVSVVGHENILGVQFHPEKSQKSGFQVIRNFLSL
jgi:imidazole glycerol-phosphate synthase subunit HisH